MGLNPAPPPFGLVMGKGTMGKGQGTDFKNPYPRHGSGVTLDICSGFFILYKFIIIITIIITIIIY